MKSNRFLFLVFLTLAMFGFNACGSNDIIDGNISTSIPPASGQDKVSPRITLKGASSMMVHKNAIFRDPGASAIDNIDGDISSRIKVVGSVNTAMPGTYNLNYMVSDLAGNSASVSRRVLVSNVSSEGDTVPPVITLLGSNPMRVAIGSQFVDPGATALDDIDGDVSAGITVASTVNMSIAGIYKMIYKVSDAKGNQAVKARDVIVATETVKIKKTGQIKSFDMNGQEGTNVHDDGYFQKGVIENYTRSGDIVTDGVTGLEWQDDIDTLAGVASYDNAQTNCTFVNLGGHSDWRLPTAKELLSIIKPEHAYVSMNTAIFTQYNQPNQGGINSFWTSTDVKDQVNVKWIVLFSGTSGRLRGNSVNATHYARCVRGVGHQGNLFSRSNSGVISDAKTLLQWQDNLKIEGSTWIEAVRYCDGLTLDNNSDWRLPNINELITITDYTKNSPSTDGLFKNISSENDYHYWTSTSYIDEREKAWTVKFQFGSIRANNIDGRDINLKTNTYNVRCVRGNQ